MQRPDQSEYAPYYQQYIKDVPQIDILEYLKQQLDETVKLFPASRKKKRCSVTRPTNGASKKCWDT